MSETLRRISKKASPLLLAGTLLAACTGGSGDTAPATTESTEVKRLMPTSESYIELSREIEPAMWEIGFLAGFFACMGGDMVVDQITDETDYQMTAVPGEMITSDLMGSMQILAELLESYEANTGDQSYETWYGVFRDVHDHYTQHPEDCSQVDTSQPILS